MATELVLALLMGGLLLAVGVWLHRIGAFRSGAPLVTDGGYSDETAGEVAEKPAGVIRWLTTVDHKDIGILYGTYAAIAFAWGGLAVILMRTELATGAQDIVSLSMYNGLLTSHGITMLFLFGTPIIAAFGNYFIPLLVGADDMAFPRVNAIAFWMLPPAALLIWGGFFLEPLFPSIGPSQSSWTMYTPLTAGVGAEAYGGAGVDLMLLGLHLSGVSTTMGAINFIATIFSERAPDVGWENLDIFSWTLLTQSAIILFSFPLLGSALIMLLLDRNFGTTFFAVDGGGSLLWQHLFWFFGHPEVYILVLPPMGLVSFILPKFAGRKLFGFKFVVYSTLAIGVLSFGVWAHHMFATGIDPRLRTSFMAVSLAIAIPSAVKTFNWITTMWNGKLRLTTPMLFSIGFVQNFIIGGVTGVFLAAVPVDLILHDTYYVVGHFHFMVFGVIGFGAFAGIYYWFPIVAKRMFNSRLGKFHFWTSIIGSNVVFLAMILLGYQGMPRRYATYLGQFATLHQLATVGAFLMLIGQLAWVYNMVSSWRSGPRVDDDPWDLEEESQFTREWKWFGENRSDGHAVPDGGAEDDAVTDGGTETGSDDGSEADGN